MTDQLENATVEPGAPPRLAAPHEHFFELPVRLWKTLLVGGTAMSRIGPNSPTAPPA